MKSYAGECKYRSIALNYDVNVSGLVLHFLIREIKFTPYIHAYHYAPVCFKKERPDVKTKGLFAYEKTTAAVNLFYGLSHHTLVLNLSAPCVAIAAFTLAVLTESSEVG